MNAAETSSAFEALAPNPECGLPDEVYAHNGAMTGLFHLSADHKYLRNYIKTKPGEYNFFDSFIGYSKEISKYSS